MREYKHFNINERETILKMLAIGVSIRSIAKYLRSEDSHWILMLVRLYSMKVYCLSLKNISVPKLDESLWALFFNSSI